MLFISALMAACAGAGREKVFTPNVIGNDTAVEPNNANGNVVWFSTGALTSTSAPTETWLLFGSASDYELFVSGTGDTPGGTGGLDTWQSMGSDLGYALSQTTIGEKTFSGTYQIRLAASHAVVGGGSISLRATVVV